MDNHRTTIIAGTAVGIRLRVRVFRWLVNDHRATVVSGTGSGRVRADNHRAAVVRRVNYHRASIVTGIFNIFFWGISIVLLYFFVTWNPMRYHNFFLPYFLGVLLHLYLVRIRQNWGLLLRKKWEKSEKSCFRTIKVLETWESAKLRRWLVTHITNLITWWIFFS